jgi:hypothetical protein
MKTARVVVTTMMTIRIDVAPWVAVEADGECIADAFVGFVSTK